MLRDNPEFVLIDEQKEAFEGALLAARQSSAIAPRVVIIEGGPGTGKTVLAINLLVRLTNPGKNTQYVSKNAAPREVYRARLVGTVRRTRFDSLFSGSGRFFNAAPDSFDALIVDEAHRFNAQSGLYENLGENQIKELIRATSFSVFLIDEDQRVSLSDIGSKEQIRRFAAEKGAVVEEYTLSSQFRCNGSDGYLAWVDQVLEIHPTANFSMAGLQYDFRVFETPHELHREIIEKNGNNRARVVAGYCWPWRSKRDLASMDIEIGTYRRQWNLVADASLWIMTPGSIDQVGCIHTCQGLELDYVGVLIGPDLIVRDGRVVTKPAARDRNDRTMRGYKGLLQRDPVTTRNRLDLIIKNTYRTLMTRGMRGCFVWSADAETREYLRSCAGRA